MLLAQVDAVRVTHWRSTPAQTVTTPDGMTCVSICGLGQGALLDGTDDVDDTLLAASEIKRSRSGDLTKGHGCDALTWRFTERDTGHVR